MLVRAVGPGLKPFGIVNALRDPVLELFRGAVLAAKTTAFASDTTTASTFAGAFPLAAASATAPGDDALLGQVVAGGLTAHCSSIAGGSGVALIEFYDVTPAPGATSPRFVNLSARSTVDSGENLMVIGFVISGEGRLPLLLRGVGPTLSRFYVASYLADPAIELYSGSRRIAANDDWLSGGTDAAAAVQAAGRAAGAFDLVSNRDAALLVSLPAGAYTLLVHGSPGQTGTALAEIYETNVTTAGFDIGRTINDTGLDLYRQTASNIATPNFALSPYSIQSALAMAYTGAAGDTRTEMSRVLRFPADETKVQTSIAGIRSSLDTIASESVALAQSRSSPALHVDPIEWHAANQLFGQQGYAFRDSFLEAMATGFAAPLQSVDFFRNADAARATINNWIASQTHQRILNLIPPQGVDSTTRLTLVNALYLKASWDVPFFASDTNPKPFYPTPDTGRNVPTMYESGSHGYSAEEGMTIVTLDYLGGGLQFVIILPDAGQTLEAVANRLSAEHFTRWASLRATSSRRVFLYLPAFQIPGSTFDLSEALQQLGMTTAFDQPPGSANFDGIAPRQPFDYLAISHVFHKTFVVVNESGTEAAAATSVTVVTPVSPSLGPPSVEVHVDHPFLFAIQHKATGACLFLGRVNDPQ